jgi:hypothetical protein
MLAALLSNVLMLVSGLVTSVVYDKVIPHQAFFTGFQQAGGAQREQFADRFVIGHTMSSLQIFCFMASRPRRTRAGAERWVPRQFLPASFFKAQG